MGEKVAFTHTISESDVYLFARLTRDYDDMHMNEEYAKKTSYGRRLVHGACLIRLMSGASAVMGEKISVPNVSYGYDKTRFRRPVFIGGTIRIEAGVSELRREKDEIVLKESCLNQRGELAAVAHHNLEVSVSLPTRQLPDRREVVM